MEISEVWRPKDLAFIADPYAAYAQLLAEGPVHRSPTGELLIMGHELVRKALADKTLHVGVRRDWVRQMTERAAVEGLEFNKINSVIDAYLLQRNPALHTRVRGFLMQHWPDMVTVEEKCRKRARTVVAELPESGNLVDLVSRRYTLGIINDIMGTDIHDIRYAIESITLIKVLDPLLKVSDLQDINRSAEVIYDLMKIQYDHISNDDEGLTAVIKRNEEYISTEGIDPITLVIFVFIAGQDTTVNLVTRIMYLLMTGPVWFDRLDSDERIDGFINEVLRLYSPVQMSERIATEDVTIGEQFIEKGTILSLCIGAANRDPAVFENPDTLDINRANSHQLLSFGHGIHHCLGRHMAILEAKVILKELLSSFRGFELVEGPVWDNRLSIRNIISLNARRR